MGQTDRATDGRTPDRYVDPAPGTERAASLSRSCDYSGTSVSGTDQSG